MNTTGIEIDENGVQVQVNNEWRDAKVIAEQNDLLFLSVDVDGEKSLQTWQSDGDGYIVICSGIADIEVVP